MVKWFMLISWILFGMCLAVGLAYSIVTWMKSDEEINEER